MKIYTFDWNEKKGSLQYYFIKNEKAYVITFSSETGKLKAIGQKILNSFELTK